jgi:hypothetical protein
LFGFGVGFYIFLRIPLLGVLIYGIAEASTAYLITKITDPRKLLGTRTFLFHPISREFLCGRATMSHLSWNILVEQLLTPLLSSASARAERRLCSESAGMEEQA